MRWLAECSAAAVREAPRVSAPALPDGPVVLRDRPGGDDPLWHYVRTSGGPLCGERVRAWRLRAALADITRRGEAGIGLPDGRAVPDRLAELARELDR